ncbi:hypothetical protein CVD28_03730 [Bacillus sp. M6-12]|uniref:hypothetical protein n=1 Tax=Bacillus sp. M6-12 TaxID=2054166 RepID=UPI000C7809A4|nr:hypothetical protein [Bacillus sp. M6-12]PLS19538.1 hypothetical protein CVD28_03730 [Bacillus sp. M6-12]
MKFDLTKIDFSKEITDQLKEQYHEMVRYMVDTNESDNNNNGYVTLFHGTNLKRLNTILLSGLVPSHITGINNFEGELKSNEHLVYLTRKWHYWYAFQTYMNYRMEETEDNRDIYNIPCYVEVRVPENKLIIDEDFFHSTYIKNRIKTAIKKHKTELEVSYEECLNQYATVAYMGKIERKDIVSFTLLVNINLFRKNFIEEKSLYMRDLEKWSQGKGKGKLSLEDLFRLEDDPANLTFMMKDIPKDNIITEFVRKDYDSERQFAIRLGTVTNPEAIPFRD